MALGMPEPPICPGHRDHWNSAFVAGRMTMAGPVPEQALEHIPERPSWRCRTCRREWPCGKAKASLAADSVVCRTSVLVYLAICRADAAVDLLPGGSPSNLYDRFIGWARENLEHLVAGSTEGINSR